MKVHKTELQGRYTLLRPETSFPLLLDSPHSGRIYPADFNTLCTPEELHKAEDNLLDHLIEDAPACGMTVLLCEFPRTYIDVNRAIDDIDPSLLAADWPEEIWPSQRSEAGIGLIRRLVRPGVPLYNRELSVEEVQRRIDHYYRPYHEALKSELDRLHYLFGQVWHLDMHSMPEASAHTADGHPVDFVLGDRGGKTCRRDFVHGLKQFIESRGYRVALNDPYSGVELIRAYSAPSAARHALQVEISKALYWDEQRGTFNQNAPRLKEDMQYILAFCSRFIEKELVQQAAD